MNRGELIYRSQDVGTHSLSAVTPSSTKTQSKQDAEVNVSQGCTSI